MEESNISRLTLNSIYQIFLEQIRDYDGFSENEKQLKIYEDNVLPILSFIQDIKNYSSNIENFFPAVYKSEEEILVPGPIFLKKENLIRIIEINDSMEIDPSLLNKNIVKIIKMWVNEDLQKELLQSLSEYEKSVEQKLSFELNSISQSDFNNNKAKIVLNINTRNKNDFFARRKQLIIKTDGSYSLIGKNFI